MEKWAQPKTSVNYPEPRALRVGPGVSTSQPKADSKETHPGLWGSLEEQSCLFELGSRGRDAHTQGLS